jgi:hypothetical protein
MSQKVLYSNGVDWLYFVSKHAFLTIRSRYNMVRFSLNSNIIPSTLILISLCSLFFIVVHFEIWILIIFSNYFLLLNNFSFFFLPDRLLLLVTFRDRSPETELYFNKIKYYELTDNGCHRPYKKLITILVVYMLCAMKTVTFEVGTVCRYTVF